MRKLDEYRAWGVSHVWLVDPVNKKLFVYGYEGLLQVPAFRLPEHGAEMPAAEIFG